SNQVRDGREPQDRQGAWPDGAAIDFAARGRGDRMRRRELIAGIGGAAAWPLAASAQNVERVRRVGVLQPAAADDSQYQTNVGVLVQALGQLGWTIGRNLQIDTRWAGVNVDDIRKHAAELISLAPDVVLANGNEVV